MKRKSVKERHKSRDFATAAKKIGLKYPKRDTDSFQKNAFSEEIVQLLALQDVARGSEYARDSIQEYRAPREASKYKLGGNLPGDNTLYPTDPQISLSGVVTGPDLSGVGYTPFGVVPKVATRPVGQVATPKIGLPTSPLAGLPNATAGAGNTESKGTIYDPLLIGKGAEFLGKAAMLIGGPDKVSPEFNPYESSVRKLMASRSGNLDAARNETLSQQNAAMADTAGISNSSVRQALGQNIRSQGMANLSNVALQNQQMNNSYRAEEAQTLGSLGQQRVGAVNYAEQLNNQSKVGYQQSLQNMIESVGGIGQKLTDYRANIAQQNLLASALSTSDFQFGDVANIIQDAVKMRKIDPDKAIQIINSSKGKSKALINTEIEQAVKDFNKGFN
jgi:hypothetical protein